MARRGGSKRRGAVAGRHEFRRKLALAAILSVAAVVLVRAFDITVLEHGRWQRRAEDQQGDTIRVPAARGTIYDRDGVPLAASREVYIVAIAPHEVQDTPAVQKLLREELGLSAGAVRGVFRGNRRWVPLPGRYEEATREALSGRHGIHFESTMRRFYPHGTLAAEVLGRVNIVGQVAGGIEQELDSVLAGRNGMAVKRIDSRGRPIPGSMLRVAEPVPGRDVVLTLDTELQEIAAEALSHALEDTEAEGGELLVVDPYTGEILAAVSQRRSVRVSPWTAATEPYEPGSAIKPFTVASLLAEGRATLADSIYAEDGSYRLYGRTINDTHPHGWLTLEEGFLVSSNIVMAKAASRMDPATQYRRLRDFGFGIPTGVGYPSESGGRLHRLSDWSKQSGASLAYGYEISVTPLQLAMAYASLASGGVLMEPRLVREVRSRDGRTLRTAAPRAVRRVVSAEVAADMRDLLAEVVESGTGKAASLGAWKVAGKTGTARFSAGGHYIQGAYIATFAGFFPAEDPQIVFLVKVDRPRGDYYASLIAAPVTKATLQAALAARGTPLDRSAVAVASPGNDADSPSGPWVGAGNEDVGTGAIIKVADRATEPAVLLPAQAVAAPTAAQRASVAVPDLVGATIRDAVRALHAAGFVARIEGSGRVTATAPAAGRSARAGSAVVIRARPVR